MVFREEDHFTSRLIATAVVLSSLCLPLSTALAQSDACISSPDPYNPSEKILRCGAALTVRPAPGTVYRPLEAKQGGPPAAVQLDSGALLIEFHPTRGRRHFQILTPQAIASARGTRWAMEVKPDQTSTLGLNGVVQVSRANRTAAVLLRRGEGVDVGPSVGPLEVKRWAPQRANALLARFGP